MNLYICKSVHLYICMYVCMYIIINVLIIILMSWVIGCLGLLGEEAYLCLTHYLAKVTADDDNDVDFQWISVTKFLMMWMIIEMEMILTRLLMICKNEESFDYHDADYVLV